MDVPVVVHYATVYESVPSPTYFYGIEDSVKLRSISVLILLIDYNKLNYKTTCFNNNNIDKNNVHKCSCFICVFPRLHDKINMLVGQRGNKYVAGPLKTYYFLNIIIFGICLYLIVMVKIQTGNAGRQ